MNHDELIALAKRVEKLDGPDREVDALIHRALNPDLQIMTHGGGYGQKATEPKYTRLAELEMKDCPDAASLIRAPYYTKSMDAAMTLLPRDIRSWSMVVSDNLCTVALWHDGEGVAPHSCAVKPALALTAAALRALAEQVSR